MNKTKLYKLVNTLLSATIAILACWYLFSILSKKIDELSLSIVIDGLTQNLDLIAFTVLLMPFNWLCEIIKWKKMISKAQRISYYSAFKSITIGVTLALLTPNGIGELGGRLLYITRENRLKALYYGAFLSLSQLLITLLVGILSCLFLLPIIISELGASINILWTQITLIAISLLLLYLYFFSSTIGKVISFFKKTDNKTQIIKKRDRLSILLISGLRYLIFTLQFICLLLIFDNSIPLSEAFLGVSTVYLVTTIIPTAWISVLVVRTSVAYYIFLKMGYSGEAGILASSILWTINLFIPALIGLFRVKDINWVSLKKQLV